MSKSKREGKSGTRKPGTRKWMKKQYNRASRRAYKGTGKTSSVAHWATEIGYMD